MLTTAALRHLHVRTVGQTHRACPCCASLPDGKATARLRRAQRRREAAAWRREQENAR